MREGGVAASTVVPVVDELTWYEYKLRSSNLQTKMKMKMSQKMTIFVKATVGFDFSKIYHFCLIFSFIFEK